MKVLITLGPTREKIDSVRFISNESSGKMGAALAGEALKRGFKTTIVSGPISINLPDKAKIINVSSAAEMTSKTLSELKKGYDIFICAAAIADYAPFKAEKKKIKSDKKELVLRLKQTVKLTAEARKKFPDLFIAAFKAETDATKKQLCILAYNKLKKENLDLICANNIKEKVLGSDYNEIIMMDKKGKEKLLPRKTKKELAKEIWDEIIKEYGKK